MTASRISSFPVQRFTKHWICVLLTGIFGLATCFTGHLAKAQQNGHYVGGITGLGNGSALPPGTYVSYLPYLNHIDSIKGPNGNTVLNLDLTVTAHNIVFAQTTPKKFLGGTYGWAYILPVVNTRFTSDLFNASAEQAGISDMFFSPLVLGWEKGRAGFTINYGFYAPTGEFDPSSSMNPGLGFWENQIEAGASYSLDKRKLWNMSGLTTWEINMSKIGLDVKPGPMFTGEYSFGRRFFKYQMNAGVAGYAYHKLYPDSGSGINPLLHGILDRNFGIGPEWQYTNIKWRLGFDFRYEYQFAAEAKTSGPVYVIGITYITPYIPHHK
jgi:hypothetical protein